MAGIFKSGGVPNQGVIDYVLLEDDTAGYPARPVSAASVTWIGWTDPGPDGLDDMGSYDRYIPIPEPV